jgi:hypothetical protein
MPKNALCIVDNSNKPRVSKGEVLPNKQNIDSEYFWSATHIAAGARLSKSDDATSEAFLSDFANIAKPAMFANYPDVVGVNEISQMLGGISKELTRRLLKSGKIENLQIGREYKSTKEDVIAYIYSNKR